MIWLNSIEYFSLGIYESNFPVIKIIVLSAVKL